MNEIRSFTRYEDAPVGAHDKCEQIMRQIKQRIALRDKLNNASDDEIERLYNLVVAA